MRVTTANHITRALRHPWCTLSFITRAVIFVLVNASLETQRFQLLATLAVVDAGLLWKGLLDERNNGAQTRERRSMDVLHGVHDEASSAISSVLPTETSVEILSLLDYTVYLTFSSGSFRG